MVGSDLKTWVREAAQRLGLDLCGIAPAELDAHNREQYLWWLGQGFQGEMTYLERQRRQDFRSLLPSVRSVICAAMVYNAPYPRSLECDDPTRGWISRYAWGEDYHFVLHERLGKLLEELRGEVGCPFDAKIYVDTGPLLERAVAWAAGLGWIAKNTCLIHEKVGSWFVLGEILTSLQLEPDEPVLDRCGSCTRCMDACPTGAIVQPYVLDATRCISYYTIEVKGSIPEKFRPALGRHVFGCDICQDVCPWNREGLVTLLPQFQPRPLPPARDHQHPDNPEAAEKTEARDEVFPTAFNPPLELLAGWSEAEFQEIFQKSPLKRARYRGFLRNVAVAMGNSRRSEYRPVLQRLAEFPDLLVQEHARWALQQLLGEKQLSERT